MGYNLLKEKYWPPQNSSKKYFSQKKLKKPQNRSIREYWPILVTKNLKKNQTSEKNLKKTSFAMYDAAHSKIKKNTRNYELNKIIFFSFFFEFFTKITYE